MAIFHVTTTQRAKGIPVVIDFEAPYGTLAQFAAACSTTEFIVGTEYYKVQTPTLAPAWEYRSREIALNTREIMRVAKTAYPPAGVTAKQKEAADAA